MERHWRAILQKNVGRRGHKGSGETDDERAERWRSIKWARRDEWRDGVAQNY